MTTGQGSDEPATLAETHISVLVFVGDRAYKLKKPVKLPFLDFSTRDLRERYCRREVELNRRLAPDVYLGVLDVLGPDGEVCDHLVAMRRLPATSRLSTMVSGGVDVDDQLRAVARLLASFHADADRSPEIDAAATADAVRRRWERNFAQMSRFVGDVLDLETFTLVEELAFRYVEGREQLFADRIARQHVVDGHGDLLADDIFCLDDGPRVIDCIEFDDALRHNDVVADVAFLAMDLERLATPDLGDRFLAQYREFAGENWPASLAHHYIAERALVRSKVACVVHSQTGDDHTADTATALLELAARHLECGRVKLVLVGGLPGSGKSTLASGLSDACDWTLLRSDEIRKDLAGLGHGDHAPASYGAGLYTAEHTAATYDELADRAGRALARGKSVVLDASWTNAHSRELARTLARRTAADLIEVRCAAPAEIRSSRLSERERARNDASDATEAIGEAMATVADPWLSALDIDTTSSPAETLASTLAALKLPATAAAGSG